MDDLTRPGDYRLSTIEEDGVTKRCVWFLLPTADPARPWERGQTAETRCNGLHMIKEPPWVIRECADGSIEIRESIASHDSQGEYFHGYLDEGNVWRVL